jgi:hypothetical protein
MARNEREPDSGPPPAPDDPTVEADEADPTEPGPGDSEGARPEPSEGE